MTLDHLKDLYRHMRWADNAVWAAVLGPERSSAGCSEACATDERILDTLHHLHATQHSFLDVWEGREFIFYRRDGASANEIRAWADDFHVGVDAYLASISTDDLSEALVVPWAKYMERELGRNAGRTTLGESIYQVVSHSMHHRGQVTRRIAELGADPPLVDYIVWLWLERPASWAMT